MKKLICMMLVISLLVPSVLAVQAADYSANVDVKTITSVEHGYTYTEYTDDNLQTIRTYKKQSSVGGDAVRNAKSSLSVDATKALLSSLGMEEGFINKLSAEELQEYSESSEIMAVSSYTKTDAEGKVVNVTKKEALDAMSTRAIVPTPDPGGGMYPTYEESLRDSYMYISFVVSYMGSGKYKFSVDSVWLTMPFFRWSDSLGACAQNMTVENNTRSGWRSYTMTDNVNGTQTVHYIEEQLVNGTNSVSFQNAINGNWYGSAVVFYLPIDGYTQYNTSVTYSDYRVHYEYIGTVMYPSLQMNFNTTASYCHFQTYLSLEPSVGIGLTETPISIAISAEERKEIRTVEFDTSITYNP